MSDRSELPLPLQKLLKNSETQTIEMELSESEEDLSLTDSKIGGKGFYPEHESYPYYDEDTPLYLLFQINFEQLAAKINLDELPQPLPRSGLLQVYIDPTCDLYGADLDNYAQNRGYQVRFWKDLNATVNHQAIDAAQEKLRKLSLDDEEELLSPIDFFKEIAIDFVISNHSCGSDCIEFDKYLQTIEPTLETSGILDYLEHLDIENSEEIYSLYNELARNDGHRILGYPYFTQADPREYDEALKKHIMLFQFDSDGSVDIDWAGGGIANFFITPEALANEDFRELLYNYDCP